MAHEMKPDSWDTRISCIRARSAEGKVRMVVLEQNADGDGWEEVHSQEMAAGADTGYFLRPGQAFRIDPVE